MIGWGLGVLVFWGIDNDVALLLGITVLPITISIPLLTFLPTLYPNLSSFRGVRGHGDERCDNGLFYCDWRGTSSVLVRDGIEMSTWGKCYGTSDRSMNGTWFLDIL